MKRTLLLATLSLVFCTPRTIAKSDLETLRALCAEQERQIHQLEDENAKLRSLSEMPAKSSRVKLADPAPTSPKQVVSTAAPHKTHQVKQGETFSSIGKKYTLSSASLIAANPGIKPTSLRPGQVINLGKPAPITPAPALEPSKKATQLPGRSTSTTVLAHKEPSKVAMPPAKKLSPTTSTAPAASKMAPASAPAAKPNIHSVTIDGPTTFGEFAVKHGTDIAHLNDLNALDLVENTVLAKGSEIYVPAQP